MMQTDNELIEKVDKMQIDDVVVDIVGFEDVESALVTSKRKSGIKTY